MLTCQFDKFELDSTTTYINCAYMSPQLKRVTAAGQKALQLKVRPYELTIPDFFEPVEEAKQLFAQLIHAKDAQRIAIIPSVSYGIANVTNNIQLSSKQHILIAEEQFPSNYYAWQRLADKTGASIRFISPSDSTNRAAAWNERILESINEDTAVVSLSHTHWADGTLFDLKAIRKRTHEVGALLVVDGTQSVGALPLELDDIPLDALICASYKWLLGPYSMGVAYYGERFDNGSPIEESWLNRKDSEDFRNLVNYQPQYRSAANRYSVGESANFVLIPMMIEGFKQLLEWQVTAIQNYCQHIAKDAVQELRALGCQIEDDTHRANHLFGIRLNETFDTDILKNTFAERKVYVSMRGDAIRIAPHLYNTKEDFQVLVDCFKTAKKSYIHHS